MNNHSFHIPVMGTGFTIDTPIKVARYGIPSVISIVDDRLIEKMRAHYCQLYRFDYKPILDRNPDARAHRITAYLNLVKRIVDIQINDMHQMPFDNGSEVCKYFEWMNDESEAKALYVQMQHCSGATEKKFLRSKLRETIVPGAIDVNIMAKIDRQYADDGTKIPREQTDAMAALRGFANSELESSVVFSAGLNLHLFGYVSEFEGFYPDAQGYFKKRITLKINDFRSALIQAKVLAKKGLWVSEYRIESGLNCGGHVFASSGRLLGPILEEFKMRKQELIEFLFEIYNRSLLEKKRAPLSKAPAVRFTAQGGVGTAAEHRFLLRYYQLDSIGWGSPFLLVPEATSLDAETLAKLTYVTADQIVLSDSSPLGAPFYTLVSSASEEARIRRIKARKPGSPCVNKYLKSNMEFGIPLCTSSFQYQQLKIRQLDSEPIGEAEKNARYKKIVGKVCLCRNLSDGALLRHGFESTSVPFQPAVCPGPNLVYFNDTYSLCEMINHIYGRGESLVKKARPHMFINELKLYIQYLKTRIEASRLYSNDREQAHLEEFKTDLFNGIAYYKKLAPRLSEETAMVSSEFIQNLEASESELSDLFSVEA